MEEKRNRSSNFTEEEKVKLLNLLQRHGEILSKKTDAFVNKKKEMAWLKLEQEFNSNNQVKRNVNSLKKVWNKLKYEAKTYKSKIKIDITGTGGGPSSQKENSILELVLSLIGRAGVGIENTPDCDSVSDSNIVIEMDLDTPIVSDIVQNEFQTEATETAVCSYLSEIKSDVCEIFSPTVKTLASSRPVLTPNSRRRPILKTSRREQLQAEKIDTEKLKQKLLVQEIEQNSEKRIEEKQLFELEKCKMEQTIKFRNHVLRKLENNEDVDPNIITSIFKD